MTDQLLSKQVSDWRKEVARLKDLIAHACGTNEAAGVAQGLTDDRIRSFAEVHGFYSGVYCEWQFNDGALLSFARALLAAPAAPPPLTAEQMRDYEQAAMIAERDAPPTAAGEPQDRDKVLDEVMQERDDFHEMADDLAAQIAAITGVEIGEHSSANDPWQNAMLAADEFIATLLRKLLAGTTAPAQQDEREAKSSEHYDEVKATLEGLHSMMESISEVERRVGPIGSHARGYTHKITNALKHLDKLRAAQQVQADAVAVPYAWQATTEDGYPIWNESSFGLSRSDFDYAIPLYTHPAHAVQAAARDVLVERRRQVETKGWTTEHDDQHGAGQLACAAMGYAQAAACELSHSYPLDGNPLFWPWDQEWWKPGPPRRMLVKAGALILAEIERIDRAAMSREQSQENGGERG